MDLSSHENSNSRPDLTIPMPPSFVAGATAAAMAAAAAKIPPGAVVPVLQPANNGNATPPDSKDKDIILKPDGTKKAVRYRECQKNHAAGIGGHALDGCGEFMPNKEDETSMRCAACDCHRNFHRREVEGEKPICDLCKEDDGGTALLSGPRSSGKRSEYGTPHSGPLKKRFRTKFSNEQKERMYVLSDKLGWRIQKHDEAEVAQFCADTGVKRHVLKVWMHNNKHTFGNKRLSPAEPT